MTWWMWTLGWIATYLAIGWAVVARYAGDMYAREIEGGAKGAAVGMNVRFKATWAFVGWPFALPYLFVSRVAAKRDPARLQRQIAEQEKEIAKLDTQIAELQGKQPPPGERWMRNDRPQPRLPDPGNHDRY